MINSSDSIDQMFWDIITKVVPFGAAVGGVVILIGIAIHDWIWPCVGCFNPIGYLFK